MDSPFGAKVRQLLAEKERTQAWLGAEVARRTGRGQPYTQAAVSTWLSGATEPGAQVVFAIERALGERPGTLSRLLGYLPVAARSVSGVRDAIEVDPKLTASGRRVVRAVYEELVDGGPDGS